MSFATCFDWAPKTGVFQGPLRGVPRLVYAQGRFRSDGNSAAIDASALRGAVGEYFERTYARIAILDDACTTLDDVLAPDEARVWRDAIAQTRKRDAPDLATHPFGLVRVVDLHSGRPTYAPTAAISLGEHADRWALPIADSCGACVHVERRRARAGALYEFIERQRLIASWLKGEAACELTLDSDVHELTDDARRALDALTGSGEVRLFEALRALPGHAVIAIFDGAQSPNRTVHACVGASAAASARMAVSKAIVELWQGCFWLERLAPVTRAQPDEFMRLFTANNVSGGARRFRFVDRAPRTRLREFLRRPDEDDRALLRWLRDEMPGPLLMHERQSQGYTRCKVVSPAFYLHMLIGRGWNRTNPFARRNGLASLPDEAYAPMPFP